MKISNFVVVSALIALIVIPGISEAQRGQGGGQRGQGGFGGRQGGFGGGMMGGGNSTMFLLQRADVQKDIKFTDAQKKELEAAQTAMAEKRRAQFEEMRNNGGGGGGFDREAMQEMMEAMQKENDAAVNKILTEEQQKRLKQISLQMQGMRILLNKDTQKELELDRTQIRKIEDLQQAQQEANQQVFARMQNGEIDRTEITSIMEKNNKILDEELGKVLNDDQKAKLKEMQGPEFKRDPKVDEAMRQGQGRGGRGGGGGGL